MRLSIKKDFGSGKLTKSHTVLLNGKKQYNVVEADNLLGYVDIEHNFDGYVGAKRRFGSIVFLLNGESIRDLELFKEEEG